MPILRYRIGDVAQGVDFDCPCGRKLPILDALHGRSLETIQIPNGRTVHPTVFTYIFKELSKRDVHVGQFQFVRTSDSSFICQICNADLCTEDLNFIHEKFHDVFGESIELDIQMVETIPKMPSGKLSYYRSNP